MIVVLIGYGEDLEVFKRCRKVWDLYVSTLDTPDVKIFFVQTCYDQNEEAVLKNNDLYIKNTFEKGTLHKENLGTHSDSSPVQSDWTKLGNLETVARQKKMTQWVFDSYGESCTHIFYTTITSIHSITTLRELVDCLPKHNVYAGKPAFFTQPFMGHARFMFMGGSNTLLSIDTAKILCVDNDIDQLGFPNDVWVGLRLIDKQKIYLPRYDIEKSPTELGVNCDVDSEIEKAFDAGHFHIRVKSTENRVHTDHIILLDIYRKFHVGRKPTLANLLKLSSQMGQTI